MELKQAIATLDKAGVPTHSRVMAGQYMNQNLPALSEAKALIQTLTNHSCSERGKDPKYVPMVSAYLVMFIVKAHIADETVKMLEVLNASKASADEFLEKMAWTFVADEDESIENADPEVVKAGKAKKGAKKVLALKVFKEQIADAIARETDPMTRKEALAVLEEEVGLSNACASTYFANFKNGKWS